MEKKISIIIFVNDPAMLDRCLDSIREQTYSGPVEVFILGEYSYDGDIEKLKIKTIDRFFSMSGKNLKRKVVNNKKGKVMIIKSSYVLSPDCLEKLTEESADGSCIGKAEILSIDGDVLTEDVLNKNCIYGCIIPSDELDHFEAGIHEIPVKVHMNIRFSLHGQDRKIKKTDSAYIYDMPDVVKSDSLMPAGELCDLYERKKELCDEVFGPDITAFCDIRYIPVPLRLRVINCLYDSKKKMSDKVTWLKEGMLPVYPLFKKDPDEKGYDELKGLCTKISSERYKVILSRAMGCSAGETDFITDSDYEDYAVCREFLCDEGSSVKKIVTESNVILKKQKDMSADMLKRFKHIESGGKHMSDTRCKLSEDKAGRAGNGLRAADLKGNDLAEFVKTCYAEKKLGFRTILSSILLWFGGKGGIRS